MGRDAKFSAIVRSNGSCSGYLVQVLCTKCGIYIYMYENKGWMYHEASDVLAKCWCWRPWARTALSSSLVLSSLSFSLTPLFFFLFLGIPLLKWTSDSSVCASLPPARVPSYWLLRRKRIDLSSITPCNKSVNVDLADLSNVIFLLVLYRPSTVVYSS